jgi:D-serine deaminase-like pyridoxal phosphate-dependent protein
MHPRYRIANPSEIISPALVVFREILEENLQKMIDMAGGPERLRPHCKTHKMRQVAELELARGITRHKAATLAEAEMLVQAGVQDVLLAYNLVGPNIGRAVAFLEKFPDVQLSVTADHPRPLSQLGDAMKKAGRTIDVLLDVDTGLQRTGIPVSLEAEELYQQLVETPGVTPAGLHVYDGQNHQTSLEERRRAVDACWEPVLEFRARLLERGFPVPRIVAGGTGSFPIFAQKDTPGLELSPGTCVFHDAGYSDIFPDLDFAPAALLLTRVISRPAPDRLTLDLGYKAVAGDPPAGRRVRFPDLPDAKEVLHNEEHLVLETPDASRYEPGDELLAIPRHVCPTSALHQEAYVISTGQVSACWPVTARDRRLTV